tara:strand:- start:1466 stop:1690 length:225 start_codon:yes stop_codon:yes gene_type:complete
MSSSVREKMARVNKEKLRSRRYSEPVLEKVRARNDEGHFISDDPSTPQNEAWVEMPKTNKKPATNKKAVAKSHK